MTDPLSTSDARPELWPALRSAFVEPTDTFITFEADTAQPPELLVHHIIADIYAAQSSAFTAAFSKQLAWCTPVAASVLSVSPNSKLMAGTWSTNARGLHS